MKDLLKSMAFVILISTVLCIGIVCLFGISLMDGTWSYICIGGVACSAFCLMLLLQDKDETTHYNR